MNSKHIVETHHSQSGLIITQKGKYKIRSVSLPNQKHVPIHNNYQKLPVNESLPHETPSIPQFWGCLVSDHFKKIQKKTLMRVKRIKSNQKVDLSKIRIQSKDREGSEMLLTHYLRRKTKIQNYQNAEKYQKIMTEKDKGKRVGTVITQGSQQFKPALQKYIDTEARQNRLKKANQMDEKIHRLNQLIKWRGSVVAKIQEQLHNIKLSASTNY